MSQKSSHAGHRERMRQRFLSSGQESFFEHELLELMLFYARPVVNTNGIAHDLTEHFGSLGKVMSADTKQLSSVKGVGEGGAAFLKLLGDFGLSYMQRSHSSETLTTAEQLGDCFIQQFSSSAARICSILCLSSRYELLRTITLPCSEILNGGIAPKELAAMLLKNNAACVCVGVNHGEGSMIPRDEDYAVAHIFGELLSAICIRFTDFIICGGGRSFSMRKCGAFTF